LAERPAAPSSAGAAGWLREHRTGARAADVRALFDRLPGVAVGDLIGRWRGSGLPTGSPLDGLLEAYGWYGKEFVDAERVHPLLFRDRSGRPRPVNPALLPVGLLRTRPSLAARPALRRAFGAGLPLLRTDEPKARLRSVLHEGTPTAAMFYDALPIVDVFKRVDDDVLLGSMDLRGLDEPFFFVLARDAAPRDG
jgi:hypothetical protein